MSYVRNERAARNFTFDEGQFDEAGAAERTNWKWLFIVPVALLLGVGGLLLLSFVMFGLLVMHFVKKIWVGRSFARSAYHSYGAKEKLDRNGLGSVSEVYIKRTFS